MANENVLCVQTSIHFNNNLCIAWLFQWSLHMFRWYWKGRISLLISSGVKQQLHDRCFFLFCTLLCTLLLSSQTYIELHPNQDISCFWDCSVYSNKKTYPDLVYFRKTPSYFIFNIVIQVMIWSYFFNSCNNF